MSQAVEGPEPRRWGLWIVFGLGLLLASILVWFVSSAPVTPPVERRSPGQPPAAPSSPPEPLAPGAHVITNPDWARKPTAEDIANYYPRWANTFRVAGRVILSCHVAVDGRLPDCGVVSESPRFWGFGKAAVRMSAEFRMQPRKIDGKPVATGQVRIPIVFGGR